MGYTLYTDGGARGNPGPAGCGYIIFQDDKLVDFGARYIGNGTNNVAEYIALELGLTQAIKIGINEIECKMDSELIVKQLLGEYKVKNEELIVINKRVRELISNFKVFEVEHIARSLNSFADKLVNIALDSASK
jgi:ribonuclease HI